MKISRAWATPLTIGVFGLMAATGLLMFFHLDTKLNKLAHEWIGWLMVAGALAHVAANWIGFKRYFTTSRLGLGVVAACVVVLAGSFLSLPGGGGGAPPPVLAMKALTRAPLSSIAALTGRPLDQIVRDLNAQGVAARADASLDSVLHNDRGLESRAMKVLFAAPGPDATGKAPQ